MYKLIIIEDEVLFRENIQKTINFHELDFDVIGAFENGLDALNAIKNDNITPDVILTDICMPHMDGLEFCEKLYEMNYSAKIVILTGHDDFNYARQALKYKVHEYLLKPITANEIRNILRQLKGVLDEERKKLDRQIEIKKDLHQYMSVAKETLLNKLVLGGGGGSSSASEIVAELERLNITADFNFFRSMVVYSDDAELSISELNLTSVASLSFLISNIAEEISKDRTKSVAFTDLTGRTVILAFGDDLISISKITKKIADEIRGKVVELFGMNCSVSCGLGGIYSELMDINTSYQEAIKCTVNSFYLKNNLTIQYTEILDKELESSSWSSTFAHDISMAVTHIDESMAKFLVDMEFDLFKNHFYNPDKVCNFFIYCSNKIIQDINYQESDNIFSFDISIMRYPNIKNIKKLKEAFFGFVVSAISHVKLLSSGSAVQVAKAVAYLEDNYQDYDISLFSVCEYLSVSISYFSTIFKKETGKTFIEYLTDLRMARAAFALSHTDKKIADIGSSVGYLNPHYFSMVFKKYSGLTPKDYRSSHK